MKDSGIEWIGNIPASWKSVPMRYLFRECTTKNRLGQEKTALKFTYGTIIPKTNFDANTDDYVANTIMSYTVVHPGVIMINCLNLNYDFVSQRIGLVKDYGAITSAYLAIEPNNQVLSAYATYQLKSWDAAKAFHNMGTGVRKTLDFSELGKKHFVLPTLGEQKNIVAFLDSKCSEIDAISADIQKEIETLEQYKRSVITEAVTKGLNPDVEMKDSGVAWCPQIPSNWQYTNPKGLFGLRTDRAFRNDRQLTASQEYGIVYQDEYMETTGNKVVTVTKDFSILKHVEPDDFVISMRSFQGGLEYSDKRGCISSAYVMLIPNKELVYAPFYRWFFKSSKYINALQSTSNLVRDGQAMRYANFVKVPLFIVPIEEQKAIASYLDEKIEKVNSILAAKKKQLEILSNYKKSLIYEYVTGKKEVT